MFFFLYKYLVQLKFSGLDIFVGLKIFSFICTKIYVCLYIIKVQLQNGEILDFRLARFNIFLFIIVLK